MVQRKRSHARWLHSWDSGSSQVVKAVRLESSAWRVSAPDLLCIGKPEVRPCLSPLFFLERQGNSKLCVCTNQLLWQISWLVTVKAQAALLATQVWLQGRRQQPDSPEARTQCSWWLLLWCS